LIAVALFEPEIPPNTGNIIRLCANTGTQLHMIRPLGFELDDKRLRRAGLDYHEWANVRTHDNFAEFLQATPHRRLWAITTRGKTAYTAADFDSEDILLFGPETRGLPKELLDAIPVDQHLRIPMLATSRSMNLSNAVSVVVYEAWRQQGFAAGA
jgi:tRNA (cytidine/uridine-2'-O-)-methyltransferase